MSKLKPNMYKKDIYSINYQKLKELDIEYLFFDLDNTIISYSEKKVNDKVVKLFDELNKMGFKCFIFSNSHFERLKPFREKLAVDIYYGSMKPLKKNYKKVMSKYDKDKCAFIGDQFMTDVIGAKRNNLFVILVDQIENDEPIYTRFWRFFEGFILRKYKRKNIFEKGKYYE